MGASDPFGLEVDALRTELNAARNEARLWKAKMFKADKERAKTKRALYEANKCLEEWIAAHDDLMRQYRRLEVQLVHARWKAETSDFLYEHLYPLAMAQLQHLIEKALE